MARIVSGDGTDGAEVPEGVEASSAVEGQPLAGETEGLAVAPTDVRKAFRVVISSRRIVDGKKERVVGGGIVYGSDVARATVVAQEVLVPDLAKEWGVKESAVDISAEELSPGEASGLR